MGGDRFIYSVPLEPVDKLSAINCETRGRNELWSLEWSILLQICQSKRRFIIPVPCNPGARYYALSMDLVYL